MTINEHLFFNQMGSLHPRDIRHSSAERTFFDLKPDGNINIRVQTEPGFAEIVIVFNDGTSQAKKLNLWAATNRFEFWQTLIQPASSRFHYHLALKHRDGSVYYFGPTGTTGAAEFYFQIDLEDMIILKTPKWMHGAVIYQIFPERFSDGDANNNPAGSVPWGSQPKPFEFQGGDLIGIREKLDYLDDLGMDVLYLNPVFTSPSNHKYDCTDYYQVDPAFGGNQALADLVEALHQRGMKIILDASFNHCHPNFFAFKDIISQGPDSKYWDWFTIFEYPLRIRVRPHLLPPEMKGWAEDYKDWLSEFEQGTGIPFVVTEDNGPIIEPSYQTWMNAISMPKINLSNPETRRYFLDVARFWISEYKIDGWRMDVVPFVTPNFWGDFRKTAKDTNPETVLLSEIWGNASFWLQGEYFDGTMNYTFRSLALDYFAKAEMDTHTFIDGCKTMLMMYAHDISQVNQNLLSSHDTPRFLLEADENIQRFRLANIFQLTMPGAPSIYYGDEIGMSGGRDPDNRRAFPWHAQDTWDTETHDLIRSLIKLRKDYPALRFGDWEALWVDAEAFAYQRFDDHQQILVVISRKAAIKKFIFPHYGDSPELLFGNPTFDYRQGEIIIEHQTPWSGSIFAIN